jgi:3-deoxy-D-manno-octulosonate 8-phosphate phosphatase KdsC-like HAD superfamily phosphatase
MESPLRGDAHGGFGERPGETERRQRRHRAPGRLSARGLSKATEADALRRRWSIHPGDTAAIGDSHNDIRLLHQVRHVFAMGHASQAVKDAADYITGTLDHHGAAAALGTLTLSTRAPEPELTRMEAGTR